MKPTDDCPDDDLEWLKYISLSIVDMGVADEDGVPYAISQYRRPYITIAIQGPDAAKTATNVADIIREMIRDDVAAVVWRIRPEMSRHTVTEFDAKFWVYKVYCRMHLRLKSQPFISAENAA